MRSVVASASTVRSRMQRRMPSIRWDAKPAQRRTGRRLQSVVATTAFSKISGIVQLWRLPKARKPPLHVDGARIAHSKSALRLPRTATTAIPNRERRIPIAHIPLTQSTWDWVLSASACVWATIGGRNAFARVLPASIQGHLLIITQPIRYAMRLLTSTASAPGRASPCARRTADT